MLLKTVAFALLASTALAAPEIKRFTAYTRPMPLAQGEVTNAFHKLQIPTGPIAVFRFEADVVEHDADGNVIPVASYDAYLHHHVVGSNHKAYQNYSDKWAPMKPNSFSRSVGFGAGTECRGTPQQFNFPYGFVTVDGEDEWIANVHIINTRQLVPEQAHRCLECPCTSEDAITADAVNGIKFAKHGCNNELLYENNTVCAATTYHGGLRCCEDGSMCLEKNEVDLTQPKSTYFLRYSLEYSEVTPEIRPLFLAGCCDATGDLTNHGNVEYDVPACDPELHPGCVHTLATRQRLDMGTNSVYAFLSGGDNSHDRELEIVFAVGHQHRGGMGISIYNDATGELLCASRPTYGTGHAPGNESEYIISMSTCTFDPPVRMKASDMVRIVSLYNNTLPHTGVMALMYMAVSYVDSDATVASTTTSAVAATRSLFTSPWFVVVAVVAVGGVAFAAVRQVKKRKGYTALARPDY